jgi:hypothetical protein
VRSAPTTCWRSAQRLLLYAVFLGVLAAPILGGTAENTEQTAKVLSVRKVLENQYFTSRFPHIHYYMLYISLDISDQTYCTEYETPVLDEILDASSAINQNVKVIVKGKSIRVHAPKGHDLKVHLTKESQC